MKRKVPESQLVGLKAHAEKSRAENTAKANEAIDSYTGVRKTLTSSL